MGCPPPTHPPPTTPRPPQADALGFAISTYQKLRLEVNGMVTVSGLHVPLEWETWRGCQRVSVALRALPHPQTLTTATPGILDGKW